MTGKRMMLPRVAAYAAHVKVATLRTWVYRGHISPKVDGCYDYREVEAWLVERDQHHARIADSRYGGDRAGRRYGDFPPRVDTHMY